MGLDDLTLRDWMVIVGVLLIVAVLVDAYRRLRVERRNRVRLKAKPVRDAGGGDDDISMLKELPSGGARVIPRGEGRDGAEAQESPRQQPPPEEPAQTTGAAPIEQFTEAGRAARAQQQDRRRETARTAHRKAQPKRSPPPEEAVPLVEGMSGRDEEPANLDWLEDLPLEAARDGQRSADEQEPGRLPRDAEPEVFMVNVVARAPGGFRGEDILHILLACDLRFGDMNFFHRHEQSAGRGPIQFSVANMVKPGVFDIDNMASLRTPGLVFFLTLPGPHNMMQAYDYMIETAQVVARNLGGDVLDETRSAMTTQTLDHARQQIRDLERRLLARPGR